MQRNLLIGANITADYFAALSTDEFFNNRQRDALNLGNIVVTDTFSLSTPNASYTNTGTVASDSLQPYNFRKCFF